MNKNFFLILITLFLSIYSKKIVFPFTTKKYAFDSSNEYKYILNNEIFTTIEVGEPSQKVELFLTMQTPFFIIKKNSTFKNYFNNETSSTYKYYDNSSIYYFNDEILKRGIQSSEKIFLKNSFDSAPTPIPDLDFIYSTIYEKDSEEHMGILGLQFLSTSFVYSKEINMMVTLKKKGLTSNYVWNLNYTSDNSGFLVIGDYPHNYDENHYDKENLRQINVHREGAQKLIWNLYFNEIKYGETDLSGHRTGKFAPQYGVIIGSNIFDRAITKEFFQKFIDNGKCARKIYEDFDYFVCDENIDLSDFKNLEFTEKDISSKKFVLTKDDLFLKKNGKLFFLVAFGHSWEYNYCWNLGKPFMKKYNFFFDEDGLQILFYEKEEKKQDLIGSKNFVYLIWIGIGVLVVIIGVLIFILTKLIKERKKKMFELEDDFDYNSGENNNNDGQKNNNGENNNEKIFKFEGDENENKFGI